MSELTSLALPHIAGLHAYTPGLQPTGPGWIKLNTNECPYPPSPKVAEAVRHELGDDGKSLRLYPNPTSASLREAVAIYHGITAAQVLIGNGSDDILNLLVRIFGGSQAATGFTFPSYSLYPVLVAIQDGVCQPIAFDRSMNLRVEAIAASTAPAFFLTSPNAPTGVSFTPAELEAVLNAYHGVLVVDEAYAPFADHDAVGLLAKYPRLVIVRTLSKAHALAGIRVGYALAHPEMIDLLDRVRDSYNVSRLSQAAAKAAIEDRGYYDAIINRIKLTRDACVTRWRSLGWFTYESHANFIFTEPKNAAGESGPAVAKALYEYFLGKKILVRYFPSHALTASFLRISVGSEEEMSSVNQAIEAWLATSP